MSFYERYEKLVKEYGLLPISEDAAKKINVQRATISVWKRDNKIPTPKILIDIANAYGVSTDYLLCRTDDPTDYTRITGQDKLTAAQKIATQAEEEAEYFSSMYMSLDEIDRAKVQAYIEAKLDDEKYSRKKHA